VFEREDTTERVFVDAHGVDDDAVVHGFRWLFEVAQQRGASRVAVVVPGVSNIENLGRVLGANEAAALKKHRKLNANGVTIEAYTDRTLPFDLDGVPVLGVWMDDKQLGKLDGMRAAAICAIPWTRDGIDDWKTNWNPTDIRTGEPGGSEDTVTDPVVIEALKSLTSSVNLTTGLGHPSDKDSAIGMFRALKAAGVDYDPEQVRAWAVRHGWESDDARELADIGEKIRDGRTVRGHGQQMWREDIVDVWRGKAE
jgi:hypothetical protein